MAEIGVSSDTCVRSHSDGAITYPCTVLIPPPNVASGWNGALRARLNCEPLETFLRGKGQVCSYDAPHPVVERIEVASLFIIDPVLSHRAEWRSLFYPDYLKAIGQCIGRISRGLGEVIQEPRLWRVAALRASARSLAPFLGLDMAASIAAESVGPLGFAHRGLEVADRELEDLAVSAVQSGTENSLASVRKLLGTQLRRAAAIGAAKMSAAPVMVTISAEQPLVH